MEMGRVIGQVVSTVKHEGLVGFTLLLVEAVGADGSAITEASPFVAIDLTGAGNGDLILIARGSAARVPQQAALAPTDAAAVATIDSIIVGNKHSLPSGS